MSQDETKDIEEVIDLDWSGSDKKEGYDLSQLPTHSGVNNKQFPMTNDEIEALGLGPKPTSLRRQTAVSIPVNDSNALNKFLGETGGRSKRRRSNRRLSKRRHSNRTHGNRRRSIRRHVNRRHSKRRM